jgi:hypothetical protein
MENVKESYLESDYCEEGFLSAQADAFVPAKRAGRKQHRPGANAEEKASACSDRNDSGFCAESLRFHPRTD